MSLTVSTIMDYIDACIWNDYMMGILITSAAEGIKPSIGFDAGVGKSTLMLDITYVFIDKYGYKFHDKPLKTEEEKWDKVFSYLHAFPWELEQIYSTYPRRYLGEPVFVLMDDMQRCFGKSRSKDNYIRDLKDRATTGRQQFAVLIGTAPDIGELARAWRYFFNFEIKVCQRGKYEVQRLKKWTDFKKPYDTQSKLDYKGESDFFPQLPKKQEPRYQKWRHEANKRFDEGEGTWRLRAIRNVLTDEMKDLLRAIINNGGHSEEEIMTYRNQALELKILKNIGLVEVFGRKVIPTLQARKMIDIF